MPGYNIEYITITLEHKTVQPIELVTLTIGFQRLDTHFNASIFKLNYGSQINNVNVWEKHPE